MCWLATVGILFGQSVPPTIEWQKEYWDIQVNPLPEHSGEDWFYDIQLSHDQSDNENGLICAGYSTYPNASVHTLNWGCYTATVNPNNPSLPELEQTGWVKGNILTTVSLLDKDGNTQWYTRCAEGEFFSVIQASDGGYVAIGRTKATSTINSTYIPYNPTLGKPQGNNLNNICSGPGASRKFYVVKLDAQGNIIWEHIYGMLDYGSTSADGTDAYELAANGWDLVETPSGGFKLIGCAADPNSSNTEDYFAWGTPTPPINTRKTTRSVVMEIDNNGLLIWKKVYGPTNYFSMPKGIDRYDYGSGTKYVVVGTENYIDPYSVSSPTLDDLGKNRGFAFMIDDSPNATPLWTQNYHDNSTSVGSYNKTKVSDVAFNSFGDIILPLADNCTWYAGNGDGTGYIEILDPNTGIPYTTYSKTNTPLPIELCRLTAYDLMVGVTATSDGGFAIVSTKQFYGLPSAPTTSHPIFGGQTVLRWNTDAYVAKFNVHAQSEWHKVFDSHSLRQNGDRANWNLPDAGTMRDVKTQECLYDIVETEDGGFAIAGNTSSNFDESYVVKLANKTRVLAPETRLGIAYNELSLNNYSQRSYNDATDIEATGLDVTDASTLRMTAYNSITIQHNSFVEAGSEFIASISTTPILIDHCFEAESGNESTENTELEQYTNTTKTRVISSSKTIDKEKQSPSLVIAPNPAYTETNLQLNLPLATTASIELYSSTGQLLRVIKNLEQLSSGTHYFTLSVADLAAGIYIIKIQTSKESLTKELILMK